MSEDIDNSRPNASWQSLLNAAHVRDERAVKSLITERFFEHVTRDIKNGSSDEKFKFFCEWRLHFFRGEIRWDTITDTEASGWVGPEVKEHGLWFIHEKDGWKLDRWIRGR